MILEVCAFNIQSCLIAEQAGAGRIELCADQGAGGITPSYGLIEYALRTLSIPVFPMIRPRGGNFLYDEHEIAIIKKDVLICRELGCPGIATGAHLPDGKIDIELMKRIVEWAHPMAVTCHKVFDRTPDAFQALEDVISSGCARVLTSGLQKTATEGASTLLQLVSAAKGRIIIMPGGGVRSSNILDLVKSTGANEFHSSALTFRSSSDIADKQEIQALVSVLEENR